VVFALLPPDSAAPAGDPGRLPAEQLLVVTQPGSPVVLSALSRLGRFKNRVETQTYQAVSVQVFVQTDGHKLYAAFVDDHLVFSPGLQTIHRSIDLSLEHLVREKTGFVLKSEYAALKKRSRGLDDFFIYADLSRLKPLLKRLLPGRLALEGQHIVEYAGSSRMALWHVSHKKTRQFISIVQFDPESLAPFQKTIYTRKPVENRRLQNMPSDLLVYFWSNWLDLPAWWRETLARSTEGELASAGRMARWLEKQTGMTMEQFLGLFGREFGFNIAEIRTSGFFPIPRICSCIEMTDRDAVEGLIEKMIVGLPVRRDAVAGIPVVSIMAANGLMQPSFALLGKFLVVADSREQIENILRFSSRRLVRDDLFRAVDMGMLQPSNLVMFARTAEIIDGLKEFVSWAGTIIAIRDEAAGKQSKILIDQVILPLLDALKMYRAKGVRCFTGPGEVVVDSVVLIADPDEDGESGK
jgi:hypothetical protein